MIREDARYLGSSRYEMTCLQCHKTFVAKRRDAKYCGQNCRKAATRRKDQIHDAARRALSEIQLIRRYMTQYPDLQIAGALELENIASLLNVTTASVTDTRVSVTTGSVTEKQCKSCGRSGFVSPASGLCLDCIRDKRP